MTNKKTYVLTKELVLEFLSQHNLMSIATYGDFPWIATVYYTFDDHLNIYFLSDPSTLHVKQVLSNPNVAVSIADSHQGISSKKRGIQISGEAHQISQIAVIKHTLQLWKSALGVIDPTLTHKVATGKMFKITPKRIKLFDQNLFDVEDGKEPVLEM
ncbi:MAG: pyridoxamine 5'-phosphate oxidase family protein [bacterium]|nr:pyridoxamine 5'-phosphate oxidase family protein [bacterium]